MFHLLNKYAKLLKFKPSIPQGAVKLCSKMMACPTKGTWEKFMVESMVKSHSDLTPCTLPPPYDPSSLWGFLERKDKSIKQVEMWEKKVMFGNCFSPLIFFFQNQFFIFETKKLVWQPKMDRKQKLFSKLNLWRKLKTCERLFSISNFQKSIKTRI